MQFTAAKNTFFCSNFQLNIRGVVREFSRPLVMGILNVTPDSFHEASRVRSSAEVIEKAEQMIAAGASVLDVGGYSSRPGAAAISEAEEQKRVIPAIAQLAKQFPQAIISVDTFRSSIAKEALASGASIVNDISAGQLDDNMMRVVAEMKAPYLLMHMRGTPQNMQLNTSYTCLVKELHSFFSERIAMARRVGITDIVIDPGFGFGKSREQNFELLRHLALLHLYNCPLMVGISRKSMIYKTLNTEPSDSLNGTTALHMAALAEGVHLLRVHDVKEAVECIQLFEAIQEVPSTRREGGRPRFVD